MKNGDSKTAISTLPYLSVRKSNQHTWRMVFAISHGRPNVVKQTSVAVLIDYKPFSWGYRKTDIVVLLMIREEDVKVSRTCDEKDGHARNRG